MHDHLPQFAFLGWAVIPRIDQPSMGRNSKDYSGCILVFKSKKEHRLFGEHHIVLFEMIIRYFYEQSPALIDEFFRYHQRDIHSRGGRVLSFGTNESILGEGQKGKISLPTLKYYFIEAQAKKLTLSLFDFTKDLSVNNVYLGRDVSETDDRCGQHIQSNERPMQFLIPDE